jgi:hypothetical protein
MVFVVLAALPAAAAVQSVLVAAGWAVERRKKMREMAKLMGYVAQSPGCPERVAAVVTARFGAEGVSPFRAVTIGDSVYLATDAQVDMVSEALERGDNAGAYALLAQIYNQTAAASS